MPRFRACQDLRESVPRATFRDMADKRKVGTYFSEADILRIDRFGSTLDIRDPGRSAVVRELTLRALDAIEEVTKTARGSGEGKRKARVS